MEERQKEEEIVDRMENWSTGRKSADRFCDKD